MCMCYKSLHVFFRSVLVKHGLYTARDRSIFHYATYKQRQIFSKVEVE